MSDFPAPGVYTVDSVHSSVGFIARYLVATKVRGNFGDFSGSFTIGDSPETSSTEFTVQANSISTNNEMRDGHLKSADFLELEKYPTLDFKSTSLSAKGDDFVLVGDLTIHGVTKSVTFALEYLGSGPGMAEGVTVAGFEARGEIDRRDFGVNFEGTLENGSLIVSNKIVVEITIAASK
jgi:polyisoprenoid-binding protein YceI